MRDCKFYRQGGSRGVIKKGLGGVVRQIPFSNVYIFIDESVYVSSKKACPGQITIAYRGRYLGRYLVTQKLHRFS